LVHVQDTADWYQYDTVQETGIRREADFAILESLGLIRRVSLEYFADLKGSNEVAEVSIHYYHLTALGVDFCEVCSRARMKELRKKDEASRADQAPHDGQDLYDDAARGSLNR
jgi:hypothetical protein